MSKQTAVEWLTQRLHNRRNGIFDGHPVLSEQQLCEQAKAMEREQIEEAFDAGVYDGMKVDKDYEYHELADGVTYYEDNYEEASHEG